MKPKLQIKISGPCVLCPGGKTPSVTVVDNAGSPMPLCAKHRAEWVARNRQAEIRRLRAL